MYYRYQPKKQKENMEKVINHLRKYRDQFGEFVCRYWGVKG